jgi:hypothetical protein
MNARRTLIALLPACLLLVAPGGALAAESTVAAGTVRDSGGALARSGTVELFADPSSSSGRSGSLPLVARTAVRHGRFSVAVPAAAPARNPADADGYRDWLLAVRTPHGATGSVLSTRDGVPAQLRLHTTPAPPLSAAGAHAAIGNDTCHYGLARQVDRRVRMSDVHGWLGIDSTFQYAAEHSADTYVGAAVETPGGHWKASGSDHVTNSKIFGQTATLRGRGDRPVTGIFKFNILTLRGRGCPKGTLKGFTRAYRFEGGMRVEKKAAAPGLSGRCNKAAGHQKLYPSTSVFTATAHSFTYDRAFSIFGVTLGSSTTFSKNAQITLANHSSHTVWVCGMSQAGQAVPIADAAMLYAGPRVSHK